MRITYIVPKYIKCVTCPKFCSNSKKDNKGIYVNTNRNYGVNTSFDELNHIPYCYCYMSNNKW